MAQSQDCSGAKGRHSIPYGERGIDSWQPEAFAEISICEKREESVFIDEIMLEHYRETRVGSGVQFCLTSPERCREESMVAIVPAVGSLTRGTTCPDLQWSIRLAALKAYVSGGRLRIPS